MIYLFFESLLFIILLCLLFYCISYKMMNTMENISSYECGFDLMSLTRIMFSYRFFLISILFLIFDIEIALMLPIPFMLMSMYGNFLFFIFILIIILGLFYEYFYGSLNWLN